MLSPDIENKIKSCALEFDVKAVWLFGSALEEGAEPQDIDLAVEGLPADKFFKFYASLFMALPKPVDLVDLSQNTPIDALVRDKGVLIYER
jgi:predicted nucleotidyltransferase